MARKLFQVAGGLSDGDKSYLSGSGAPGGDTGFQDAAGVGSQYQDILSGTLYIKDVAGAGTANWKSVATSAELAALTGGISWREPVKIVDTTAVDTTAALADLNADDLIQGVAVQAGDRMLFSGIVTSPNVYIVGGSSGAWTLTESVNEETAGDTVQCLSGDNASKMFQFDGTSWNWIGQNSADEDGFIRAFIGKGGVGSEAPTYTSTNHVVNGQDLETAVGVLDAAIAANDNDIAILQTATTDLQTEVNNIEAGAGLNIDGTYAANGAAAYIASATSLRNADDLLDSALLALSNDVGDIAAYSSATYIAQNDSTVTAIGKLDAAILGLDTAGLQTEIDNIEASLGTMVDVNGNYVAFTASNYMNAATDTTQALEALDAQALANATAIAAIPDNQAEVDAIEAALGAMVDANGNYVAFTASNYMNAATDTTQALEALDAQALANASSAADKLPLAGGTMDLGANIILDGGEVLGAPSTPSAAHALASKAYVDALAGGNIHWETPVWYIDLISDAVAAGLTTTTIVRDIQTPANDSLDVALAEHSDMYIIGAGASDITLRAVGATGNILDIGPLSAGDVVRFNSDPENGNLNPTWEDKGHITTFPDMRGMSSAFVRARWGLNITSDAALAGNFAGIDNCAIELVNNDVGGAGTTAYDAHWGLALSGATKEVCQVVTVAGTALGGTYLTDTVSVGPTYPFNSTASIWFNTGADANPGIGTYQIEVAINAADTDVQVAAAIKTAIEAHPMGNALYAISVAGNTVTLRHRHYGDILDIGAGTTGMTVSVPTQGTDTPIAPQEGVAFYVANSDSLNFGKQYTYVAGTVNNWVEIGATVSISPGTGLSLNGNILNVNFGAGIEPLPSDEVGLDLYPSMGLFLTEDGITESLGTAARLAIQVDPASMAVGASGLAVAPSVLAEIDSIEAGAGLGANGDYLAPVGSAYHDAATSLANADLLLDAAILANATSIANLQTNQDALETSIGAMIDVNGAWVGFTGTNYLDAATDMTGALTDLDTQVKANADAIAASTGGITETSAVNVTATTVIDSVLVDDVALAKWLISFQNADASKKAAIEVFAIHDGTPVADATGADWNEYGKLKIGPAITGLDIQVTVSGTGAAQVMELAITSTEAVDVLATRLKA